MSQPALPNRHLFSSFWTQLIVTAEKLSLFQIYKAQKRGGGFGGNPTAPGTIGSTGICCWPGMLCYGSCPIPAGTTGYRDPSCSVGPVPMAGGAAVHYVTQVIPLFPPTQAGDAHTTPGKRLE